MNTFENNPKRTPEDEERRSNYTKLDPRTTISLMAAVIYGTYPDIKIEQAVDDAILIDRAVGDKLRLYQNQRKNAIQRNALQTRRALTPNQVGGE